jgi:hypothetical protein
MVSLTLVLVSFALGPAHAHASKLPKGYLGQEHTDRMMEKTLTIRLDPDLSHLTAAERDAAAILIEAGVILNRLYEVSRHREALDAHAKLVELHRKNGSVATRNLLDLYRIYKGPVGRDLDGDMITILPVEDRPPGRNVYPWRVTKEEMNAFMDENPGSRKSLLHLRTVVRRATRDNIKQDRAMLDRYPALRAFHDGIDASVNRDGFYAVPYSIAYADELMKVVVLLRKAADVVENDDVEFARYLRHRAVDLMRDDYEAGDAAWVSGGFGNLNVQMGSYEVYDDQLFGVKSFFGVSVLARDAAMSASLRTVLPWMQEFEDGLPYEHHKTVRSDIPVGVYNIIADFGQARGTNTATILPNESYITRKYGRTILLRKNILENPDIFKIRKDAYAAAVVEAHHDVYTLKGDFFRTMFHEIGHYLGVDRTHDGRTLSDALEEDSSILEELKADLVSLFLAKKLNKKQYYSDDRLRSVQAAGIRRTLRKSKPSKSQTYATMQLMQMNYYLERGMLAYDAEKNRLSIDFGKYHQAVEAMLEQVLELQYRGDKAAADSFIEKYTTWDENLHARLAQSMRESETYRYAIVRYAALGE